MDKTKDDFDDKYDTERETAEEVPEIGIRADGMIAQLNWDMESIRDFMSDFFDVDIEKTNDSTNAVGRDMYEELMNQGVGKVNAELMSSGVEWYLDRIVSKMKR